MGIKYGFCSAVRGRRVNLGRTNLICGCNAYTYATDLSGSVNMQDVSSVAPSQITDKLCISGGGACGGTEGTFFADSATYNIAVQNNPVMIGCCSDHLIDEGKLINTTISGVTTSAEHTLSVQGKGEPWSVEYTNVRDAIIVAIDTLNNINMDYPPTGGIWVPTSADSNIAIDDWQNGSASWTLFEGLNSSMIEAGILLYCAQYEDNVSVNTQTGRVDATRTLTVYDRSGAGSGGGSYECSAVDATQAVCDFTEALNTLDLTATLPKECN